jgi:NTE family protein
MSPILPILPTDEADREFLETMRKEVAESNLDSAGECAFKLATLHNEFGIPTLQKELDRLFQQLLSSDNEEKLKDNCTYYADSDTWVLDEPVRTQLLNRMSLAEIRTLVAGLEYAADDWQQRLLNRLLTGEIRELKDLQPGEYMSAYNFVRWARHDELTLPSEAALLKAVRRESLKTPLQRLTVNFSGRDKELAQLDAFVRQDDGAGSDGGTKYNLFITGIGGIGKSTLVAKFILEKLEDPAFRDMPFVYIDFDNPGVSVDNIYSLIREALSRLSWQNARYEQRFLELIDQLNFDQGRAPAGATRGAERESFYLQSVTTDDRIALSRLRLPVLIVLDSFEEVQFRTSPGRIDTLFQTLDEIKQIVPTLKVICIGRAEIVYDENRGLTLPLENFDSLSTQTFLESMGIRDNDLVRYIYEKFGGNPLTLRLAAGLLTRELPLENLSLQKVQKAGLFEQIDRELVQQQLVMRNLGHIHHKEVAKIAVPGMLLRRIDPDLIRQVLAGPCQLGEIDGLKAEKLFAALKKEVFLLNIDDEEVEFRKDLRVALYDLILKEHPDQAREIHNATVEYYKDRPDPQDQAEYLFHRLKRGDPFSIIGSIYQPAMRPYLETALSELHETQRVELSRLMGIGATSEGLRQVPIDIWQQYWVTQIRKTLDFGDLPQLIDIREKLEFRKEAKENPEFLYYRALLQSRLLAHGDHQRSIDRTQPGIYHDTMEWWRCMLLISHEREFYLQFPSAFDLIPMHIPAIGSWPDTPDSLRVAIDLHLTSARLAIRLSKANPHDLRDAVIEKFRSLPESGTMNIAQLFALFPKPYQLPIREWHGYAFPNANLFQPPHSNPDSNRFILKTILQDFFNDHAREKWRLTEKTFADKLFFLRDNIRSNTELETYARRIFKAYTKDISLPGTLDVSLFDFLVFADIMPRQTEELVLERLSSPAYYSGKRNTLTSDDYVSMSEVKLCLEKLDTTFGKTGKRKLIVSDIQDEAGNQYVNLVLRGFGVHLFSLLGYTYILEQMGIRFLKLAGSKMGAIPGALLAVSGPKTEGNTLRALDQLCKMDIRKFMDGPFFFRAILSAMGTRDGHSKRIIKWITIVFFVFFFLVASIPIAIQLIDSESRSVSWWSIFYSVAASIASITAAYFILSLVRITRFGGGANPGIKLREWIRQIFSANGVHSTRDLVEKTSATPALRTRPGVAYNTELLKGTVSFIAADVVSQNQILFPSMAPLFWKKQEIDDLDPSFFVRAAASTPLLFENLTLRNLPLDAPEVRQAWIDVFGEYDPVEIATFTDGGFFNFFPIGVFQARDENAPLPTFGADTMGSYEKIKTSRVRRLTFAMYLTRLLDTARYNIDREQIARGKTLEKAICDIEIRKIGSTSYFVTDDQKLELFISGAQAAAQFLIDFDWETYRKSLNTSTSLRL